LLDALPRHCCDSPHIGRLCLTTGPEWATRWGPEADDVWNVAVANRTVSGLIAYALQAARIRAGAVKRRWLRPGK